MIRGILNVLDIKPLLHPLNFQMKALIRSSSQYCYQNPSGFSSVMLFMQRKTPWLNENFRNWNFNSYNTKGVLVQQTRPVTKFSWKKGTRKSVKIVPKKFFRLHWGIWIRTIAGRHKKLWKKSGSQKNRLLQHVFCNVTQSKMLDKMVTSYWRKPKYYLDDPYEIYHVREDFPQSRRKPYRPEE